MTRDDVPSDRLRTHTGTDVASLRTRQDAKFELILRQINDKLALVSLNTHQRTGLDGERKGMLAARDIYRD